MTAIQKSLFHYIYPRSHPSVCLHVFTVVDVGLVGWMPVNVAGVQTGAVCVMCCRGSCGSPVLCLENLRCARPDLTQNTKSAPSSRNYAHLDKRPSPGLRVLRIRLCRIPPQYGPPPTDTEELYWAARTRAFSAQEGRGLGNLA